MEINGFEIIIYRLGQFTLGFIMAAIIFTLLKIIEIYTQKPRNET